MNPKNIRLAGEVSIYAFAATVPLTIAGANISWGLLAACLLALALTRSKEGIQWSARSSALEKPLLFFLAVSVLTSALGTDPAHSFKYTNQDIHKIWLYYLFMIGLGSFQAPRWKNWLMAAFSVSAAIGIYQSLPTLFNDTPHWERVRAHAFVHAVTFGDQMAIALIGGIAMLLSPDPTNDRKKYWLTVAFSILVGTALFLSHTRAAILSAIAGISVILLILPKLRKWVLIAIPLSLLSIAGLEVVLPMRAVIAPVIEAIRTGNTDSRQLVRIHLWDGAIKMAKANPITGVGHNNFRSEFPRYVDVRKTIDGNVQTFGTAHNLYFHHLAERGLIGLAAVLWLLATLLLQAWRISRDKPTATNLWALGTITAFLLQNLTEVALQVEILWMLVFFIWIAARTEYNNSRRVT